MWMSSITAIGGGAFFKVFTKQSKSVGKPSKRISTPPDVFRTQPPRLFSLARRCTKGRSPRPAQYHERLKIVLRSCLGIMLRIWGRAGSNLFV